MKKILVTGSTGGLGKAVVLALLQSVPAEQVIASARDVAKAEDLVAKGVEVRRADYNDFDSLRAGFEGVHTVFFVSAVAFTDRTPQHANVIRAARDAGVQRLLYTGIERNGVDDAVIHSVTNSDIETEALLRESGLKYTVIKHPLYIETMPAFLGSSVFDRGVRVPSGNGRIPLTSRDDLAQGAAALLLREESPRELSLNNGQAYTFAEVASALSSVRGSLVGFVDVSQDTYIRGRVAEGVPYPVAKFFSQWFLAVGLGAFDAPSPTLAELLDRKPESLKDGLARVFALPARE